MDMGAAPMDGGPASIQVARALVRSILGADNLAALELILVSVTQIPHGETFLGIDFELTCEGSNVRSPTDCMRMRLRFNALFGGTTLPGRCIAMTLAGHPTVTNGIGEPASRTTNDNFLAKGRVPCSMSHASR